MPKERVQVEKKPDRHEQMMAEVAAIADALGRLYMEFSDMGDERMANAVTEAAGLLQRER